MGNAARAGRASTGTLVAISPTMHVSRLLVVVTLVGCAVSPVASDRADAFSALDARAIADAGTSPDGRLASDGAITDASVAIDATSDAGPGDAGPVDPDPLYRPRRHACEFHAGDHVHETIGITEAERSAIPIRHVIVFMQENRSFDHYFGRLTAYGHPVDGFPDGFSNPTPGGGTSTVRRSPTTCISPDIHHGWAPMHAQYGGGALDGFYTNAADNGNGRRALYWLDERDIPFYYWVYSQFAMADRHFSSVMGPTWPNRDYLYAATSDGVRNTDERIIHVRNVFDALHDAGISFREYTPGHVRSGCAGRTGSSQGVTPLSQLFTDLADGTLPRVSFVDVSGDQDEHSVADVQAGETFFRRLVMALFHSPDWPTTALFYTYDEAGGFFDHVPPPHACVPDGRAVNAAFDRMGFRVPLLVVSPWARPGHVSHRVHEATSITRFIELLFDLPALTNRDANSDALLDMFDFDHPALMTPPTGAPAAGTGGCP